MAASIRPWRAVSTLLRRSLCRIVAKAVAQPVRAGGFRDDGHFLGAGHAGHAQPAGDGFGGAQLDQGVEAGPPDGEHQEPRKRVTVNQKAGPMP